MEYLPRITLQYKVLLSTGSCKKVIVGQTEWLNQIPGEPRLRIKFTEHSEYLIGAGAHGLLIGVVDNFVQSWLVHSSCFEVLTASRLNLAVFSNKRFRTRTIVPNAGWLTDFIAGSSIKTRIISAAAIDATFSDLQHRTPCRCVSKRG